MCFLTTKYQLKYLLVADAESNKLYKIKTEDCEVSE